jgi:hypothetical protein
MRRIELACYALMACALVLAGLLVTRWQERSLLPQAQAEMVVTRDNFTAMTARTRNNEESLFVLENNSQRLLIYSLNLVHNRIELAYDPIPLDQLFRTPAAAPAPRGGR